MKINDGNSEEMSQMSEINTNEKLGVCTFCENKNEIENRTVTCVYAAQTEVYHDSRKESKFWSGGVKFDPIEWTIILCHSCIVGKRKGAFTRESLKWIGLFSGGWAMVLFLVPWLRRGVLPELMHPHAFHTIFNIFLYLAWGLSVLVIIASPIALFTCIKEYRKFRRNISDIKEKDKEIAFIEAGQTILDDLQLQKDASKFKHFPLPKLPTYEDISEMYPDHYVEYTTPEIKILCS